MRHVSCILLLEWSTTSQRLWVYRISVIHAQKYPRVLFEQRREQPREFWSLVSTIDGSTLPQDCVEEQLYTEHEVTGKTYNYIFFLDAEASGNMAVATRHMPYQCSKSRFHILHTLGAIGSQDN